MSDEKSRSLPPTLPSPSRGEGSGEERREPFFSSPSPPEGEGWGGGSSGSRPIIRLPANGWKARPHQERLWAFLGQAIEPNAVGKRAVAVWHRRAGKDSLAINFAAVAARRRPANYWHMLPTATQGRKVVWEGIDGQGRRMIDQAFPPGQRTGKLDDEMLLRLKGGSTWQVVGSDNFDRLVGANPAGVDLMRNAPVDCPQGAPWGVGGQRFSARLPWYRGPVGAPMQPEAQALCEVVGQELLGRPLAITVDCHSGFGFDDRLWFPHAHTATPIDHLAELHALSRLLDGAMPHHRYRLEPQSHQYLTHGDLWDHLYLQAGQQAGTLLPLTLEMGSWLWIKKNPRQAFSRHGIFNPLITHRQQRVLRRHVGLLDCLMRAAASQHRWRPEPPARAALHDEALRHWYGAGAP